MSTMKRRDQESCEKFLERLSWENLLFYESDRGKGALKDLQQKFPHSWLYVAELIQNAVDENANIIRLEIVDEKTFVFEHNGKAFDYDRDVIGLCTKGVSSKGAGTVGFMGVGFKAVFRSYETVRVSSGDWKFQMNVKVSVGDVYEDKHRDWLGAVLPFWNNSIPDPSEGMTCRFELADRVIDNYTIESDLEAVIKNNKSLLPLLARQGVRKLFWGDKIWTLTIDKSIPLKDNSGHRLHITAINSLDDETYRWIIFSQEYKPSKEAIRKFLEHRQLFASTPEEEKKIYSDASRKRKVDAFFEAKEDLFPILPDTGEAYALLPTSVKLPIGINIHADWLLTQSRQEFMDADLKDNQWHREIINNIPKITKHYFEWLTSSDGPPSGTWKEAYKVLPCVDENAIDIYGWFLGGNGSDNNPINLGYCKFLCEELSEVEFIPKHIPDDKIEFLSQSEALILPEQLSIHCGEKLELLPWVLFGENIASRELIGSKAVDTLTSIGLLEEITSFELAAFWEKGVVQSWYENFDIDIRDGHLETLLQGLFEMHGVEDWELTHFKCLPSENGEFTNRHSAVRYPSDWNIIVNNPDFVSALKPFIEEKGDIISWSFDRTVTSRSYNKRTKAKDYIETINQAKLSEVVELWWDSLVGEDILDIKLISRLTAYICEKFNSRKELINKVICINADQKEILCNLGEALLAEPYANEYRKTFYPEYPTVSNCYNTINEALNWRSFFESCVPPTLGQFIPETVEKKMNLVQFREAFPNSNISLRASPMRPIPWNFDKNVKVDNNYLILIDFKINDQINSILESGHIDQGFSEWLNEDTGHLKSYTHKRLLYIPFNCGDITEEKLEETTNWIQKLINFKWIYSKTGNDGPYKPEEVLKKYDPVRPESPVADLGYDLIQFLESVGINFGAQIPKAGPMQKLQIQGEELSTNDLLDVLLEILNEDDNENLEPLKIILERHPLIPVPDRTNLLDGSIRVPFSRIVKKTGPGFRSNLGWVIAVTDLKFDPFIIKIFDLLKDIYEFPTTTTANQAIDVLEWTWSRKPDAESVRRFLPFAYAYINEEITEKEDIKYRWNIVHSDALVYTLGRQWVPVNGEETIYFNDLQITDFKIVPKKLLVTPSHLASSDHTDQQKAAAQLLGINLLSDDYQIIAEEGTPLSTPELWLKNFIDIQTTVLEILKIENIEDPEENENIDVKSAQKQNLGLNRRDTLAKKIVRSSDNHVLDTNQVYAIQKENTALICGEPIDFASELCNLLISYYNADRKKNIVRLVSELTSLLIFIDHNNFSSQINKFKHKFGIKTVTEKKQHSNTPDGSDVTSVSENESDSPENDQSKKSQYSGTNNEGPINKSSSKTESGQSAETNNQSRNEKTPGTGTNNNNQLNQNGGFSDNQKTSGGSEGTPPTKPGHGRSSKSSAHDNPSKKTNRMLSYVSGETTASDDKYEISDDESPENIAIGRAAEKFVMEFEQRRGWDPINMNDKNTNHEGYDIESIGPDGRLIYIEVKGIKGPWTNVGVGLSATQFKYASKYQENYFLYVVEHALEHDDSMIYRIENPAQQVTKFQFDHGWKNLALAESDNVEQQETEIYHLLGLRVKIVSMGNKEGEIIEVTKHGKLMRLKIKLDDGDEIQKINNPNDVEFIK